MVINSPSDIYLTGNTESTDFPTSTSAYDPTFNGGWDDIFVLRLGIPSPPGPPANLNAWAGDNLVQLSWEPPSFDGYSSITGYKIYRGFNKDYLSYLATTSSGKRNYIDASVTDGNEYFYLISAVNSMGEGENSTIVNATPGGPPSFPYNLVASPGDGVIQLSWDAPVDDNGFTITNYTVYRALPEENLSELKTLGNIREYTDTNVNNGITYSYSVSAHNVRGESLQSESISSTPGTIPSAPTNLMVEEGDGYVLLTWEPPADNGWLKITNYRIYRGTDEYALNMIKEISNVLNYNDTSVENGRTYYYSVSAVNAMGTGPRTEAIPAYPASIPGSPILSVIVEDGVIELYWENYDTTDQGISHYSIYKTIKHNYERVRINTTKTNYSDYDIINGVSYSYGVKAVNKIGASEISNIITVTPQGPPSPPFNLSAVGGNEYVYLEWEVPELTGGRWINEYRIYRGLTELDTSYLTYSLVEYYNDTDIENGVSYYYTVTAVNEIGESTRSEPVNVIPLGRPGNVLNLLIKPSDGKVSLEWQEPLYDGGTEIQGYRIYRGTTETDLSLLYEVSELSCDDNSVTNGETYYYKIVPFNDFGEGKLCEINSVMPCGYPGVPENLKIELVNGNVLIGWDPPPSDGGLSIERYKIYRKTKDFEFMELTSVEDLTYLDGNVLNGNEYYYKVTALNLIGEGEATEEMSITVIKESKDGEGAQLYILIIALSIIIILIIIISILVFRKKIKKKQQMTPQPESTATEQHKYPSETQVQNEQYERYPTDWPGDGDNGPPQPPINPQQTYIPPPPESETRSYSPPRGYRQSNPGYDPYEEYAENDY
jgi:titin